jgi:hypothetical protein
VTAHEAVAPGEPGTALVVVDVAHGDIVPDDTDTVRARKVPEPGPPDRTLLPVSNPYGNDPYGQQPPSNPYGAPAPAGGFPAPAKTDGVSIASFVLSLLCCGPVGLVLGIVGLGRTKNGQRKGRWAAILGIVIGIVGMLAAGGITAVIVFFVNSQITPDNAEVGQCMDIREDGDSIYLTEKDCTEDHDGEIVFVDEFGVIEETDPSLMPDDINDLTDAAISYAVCSSLMDPADVEKVPADATWGLALTDPNDPADDDKFICYVEGKDTLDEPIL